MEVRQAHHVLFPFLASIQCHALEEWLANPFCFLRCFAPGSVLILCGSLLGLPRVWLTREL